jgi:8-oxo-dGTP pyrophosphatase MutT (NUDIX family)
MGPPADLPAISASLLRERLNRFDVQTLPLDGRRHAAVVLAVCEAGLGAEVDGLPWHTTWQAGPALLLTRRASHLRQHAGQWALPGGRVDAGESVEQAGLRELQEETGVELAADAVLGRLDDYATRSGYVVTPLVAWAGPVRDAKANPDEVAALHRIPLGELLRDDAPIVNQPRNRERPVLRMPIGQTWIAAPTAAFLLQFREVLLLQRATRVAHFDQPFFAWR